MAAEHADDFHAWHVGLPVAYIYHLRERNALLVLRHALIHLLGITCTENALVYLEDELRLGSVVDRDSRPLRLAFLVIDERTGENMLELLGYRATLDNLFQAGRIDIVLHLHAMRLAIFIHEVEPSRDPVEQLDVLAEFLELAAFQADAVVLRLIEHQLHVRKNVAGILAGSDAVAHFPELLRRLADGLDETEFLHVAGRKSPVKIINQSYNWLSSHSFCVINRSNIAKSC